jgi:hypothetical protein
MTMELYDNNGLVSETHHTLKNATLGFKVDFDDLAPDTVY